MRRTGHSDRTKFGASWLENLKNVNDWARLIEQDAAQLAFGKPVLMNTHRAIVAEAIVARALGDCWRHCAADWHAFDFERADGVALEVKQSAAKQSWTKNGDKPSKVRFDIAERKRAYLNDRWINIRKRWANIYVFAYQPCTTADTDHRDPHQWLFYVARESDLPIQNSLSLNRVIQFSRPSNFDDLDKIVNSVSHSLIY